MKNFRYVEIVCRNQNNSEGDTSVKGYAIVPYIQGVTEPIKRINSQVENRLYTKHEIAWENSKVITTNNRYVQRLCLEAWHINMSNYALNRDDGAYLPEEYMHLIGR